MRKIFTFFAAMAIALPGTGKAQVGAYVWGNYVQTNTTNVYVQFYNTIQLALWQGYSWIRVTTSPATDTPFLTSDCKGANENMACVATIMFASNAWDNSNLKTVEITALDATCSSVQAYNCFTPSFLTTNSSAIQAEYTALFQILYNRFASRLGSMTFYISNWEADNYFACGSSYDYERNIANYDATCDASFPSEIQSLTARAQGYYQHVGLVDAAVAAFKASHPAMTIISIPQGNNYNQYASGAPCNTAGYCHPATDTLFKQLQINGRTGPCDYSSYNTQGPPDGAFLASVQDIIANSCPGGMIIGEFGLDAKTTNVGTLLALFAGVGQLLSTSGVLGAFQWWFNDPPTATTEYGLYANGAAQLSRFDKLVPVPLVPPQYR